MNVPALAITIDKSKPTTLQKQLQQSIVEGIITGKFPGGARLPSTRELADQLQISRNTVSLAYSELEAIDLIDAKDRSGYFIAAKTPSFTKPKPAPKSDPFDLDAHIVTKPILRPRPMRPDNWREYPFPFIYGQGDPSLFDHHNWRQCALEALGRKDFETVTKDSYDADDPLLLKFIVSNLLPQRGIFAEDDEVLITLGAQNALMICAELLLDKSRRAVLENPAYMGTRDVIALSNCEVISVDVDDDGLPPEKIPERCDIVFTSASHQCPTSVTMSMERRHALLERAEKDNFIIIEDDYEFEIPTGGSASPALKALDNRGQVIHIGSFSKSLFPSLRLGFIVAPKEFINRARDLRTVLYRHAPGITQRTASYFVSLGYYDSQVKKITQAYRRRHAVMMSAIQDYGLTMGTKNATSGSSFWMKAPDRVDTKELAKQLREDGVLIEPGFNFFYEPEKHQNYYRIAYSSIHTDRIAPGIAKISQAIESY